MGEQPYEVIGIEELRTGDSFIVHVANPWAKHFEWTGDFSAQSVKWKFESTSVYSRCYDPKALNDRTNFWMPVADFLRLFDETSVSYISRHSLLKQYQTQRFIHEHGTGISDFGTLLLSVTEDHPSAAVLSIEQLDRRLCSQPLRGARAYRHAPGKLAVCQVLDHSIDQKRIHELLYIDGASDDGTHNTMTIKLNKLVRGTYLVLYKFDWIATLHHHRQAVVTIQGIGTKHW